MNQFPPSFPPNSYPPQMPGMQPMFQAPPMMSAPMQANFQMNSMNPPNVISKSNNQTAAPADKQSSKKSDLKSLLEKSAAKSNNPVDLTHHFDGEWLNKKGHKIFLNGNMVNERPFFSVVNERRVQMVMEGTKYTGDVLENGMLIHWSDNDEWRRTKPPPAAPAQQQARDSSPMDIDEDPKDDEMQSDPPISADEDEKPFSKKKKNKPKKKGKVKMNDNDAKKEIASKIKAWLKEQQQSSPINRDDFKAIARKCTDKMWKHYQTKRKKKATMLPKEFLSKRRSGKIIALINKYIEQARKKA